jgi:hypothetical protein
LNPSTTDTLAEQTEYAAASNSAIFGGDFDGIVFKANTSFKIKFCNRVFIINLIVYISLIVNS